MMKYLLLLSTLTLSLMFSSASSAEWTEVAEGVSGTKSYVDLDRIRKNDGYVYVWVLTDLLKPDEDGDWSWKVYNKVDCKALRFKVLSSFFYRQSMGGGEGRTENTNHSGWFYPPPDSAIEIIVNRVCAQ